MRSVECKQRKTCCRTILVMVALAVFVAAHVASPVARSFQSIVGPPKPPLWRVLIYMAADNDLEPSALGNLAELRNAAMIQGVPVALQLDRSAKYSHADQDWVGTHRFIRRQTLFGSKLAMEEDLGVVDSASKERLHDFLRWGTTQLAGQHTLLVLWGHGRGDRGLLWDEGAGTAMSTQELANALDAYRVDVIALDLCSMQTIDVATALAGRARYAAGSETPRHALGWPYGKLLAYLETNEDVPPRELAVWLAKHAGDRGGSFTGSAIDLEHIEALSSAVYATLKEAGQLPPEKRAWVADQLTRIPLISRGARSLDLGSALNALEEYLPQNVAEARRAYARAVVQNRASIDFPDATGLSVRRSSLCESVAWDDVDRRRQCTATRNALLTSHPNDL